MTELVWDEGPISKNHDRAAFDCGEDSLNIYLNRYARQNHESGGAKCFVASPHGAPARILGFYTLSPASIEFSRAPAVVTRGLLAMKSPFTASAGSPSNAARRVAGLAGGSFCARRSGA